MNSRGPGQWIQASPNTLLLGGNVFIKLLRVTEEKKVTNEASGLLIHSKWIYLIVTRLLG